MNILLSGGSGLLGANLAFELARAGHEVTALYNSHPMRIPGVRTEACDLVQHGPAAVKSLQPDLMVHCAAATNVEWCESHARECMQINGVVPGELAAAAGSQGIGFVCISTDAVFSGDTGGYRESDPVGPVNEYARSKVAGEVAVLQALPAALVLRVNIYGWNLQPKNSLAEWILSALRNGQAVPGFDDVSFSPVLVNDLAGWILQLHAAGAQGIYHLSSSDHASKYDFAVQLAEVFGFDPALIRATSIQDSTLTVERPRHTWLRFDKAASVLGKPMPTVRQGLERFRDLHLNGFTSRLKQAALN